MVPPNSRSVRAGDATAGRPLLCFYLSNLFLFNVFFFIVFSFVYVPCLFFSFVFFFFLGSFFKIFLSYINLILSRFLGIGQDACDMFPA